MKIIIDTDKKEIILIGLVTLDEINAFCKDHNLIDYSISSTDTSTHWYRGWQPSPLDPPYKITCTGDPITIIPGSTSATVSHVDQIFDAPKVGGFMDDIDKIAVDRFTNPHGIYTRIPRKIIGMRPSEERPIKPMTPEDAFQ